MSRLLRSVRGGLRGNSLGIFKRLLAAASWRMENARKRVLHGVAVWHRRRLTNTVFVAVTGSAGKTTAKDLIAAILERHLLRGKKNEGSLNWPEDMVRVILGTQKADAYCVTEVSAHAPGAMDSPLALVQPTVGVVTTVGADHFSAFKSQDAIAQEKGKLISALPTEGIAVLNADDSRVLAMGANLRGRVVTFGLKDGAMLRGEVVQAAWPDRLSLKVTWMGQSMVVTTRLCGSHWAPTLLSALATGLALGVPLRVAADAVAGVEPFEGRMSPLTMGGMTFIRDDWKAPLSTIGPSFEFMRQARAVRKVIVIGTISDYQGDSSKRYAEVAQQALAVADSVVFVGPRASASMRAKRKPDAELRAFAELRDAAIYLSEYLRPGDLVLLKGSHKADHMQRLILARTADVKCWRSDCGRMEGCDVCDLLQVPSGPKAAAPSLSAMSTMQTNLGTIANASGGSEQSVVVIIGLGNPEASRVDTPHNVGYRAVDELARRINGKWAPQGDFAMVARGRWKGWPICLVKPTLPMNEIGPGLKKLASDLSFNALQCILLHDDLDLPLGKVRVRARGGDGGHRGVRSILQAFQDDKFRRVKIGVGQPHAGQSVADYVLTPFPADLRPLVDAAVSTAADRAAELVGPQGGLPERSPINSAAPRTGYP